jgi:hypothetical protein
MPRNEMPNDPFSVERKSPSIFFLILRSSEAASRRRFQRALEAPSSFETPPAAALRMRA